MESHQGKRSWLVSDVTRSNYRKQKVTNLCTHPWHIVGDPISSFHMNIMLRCIRPVTVSHIPVTSPSAQQMTLFIKLLSQEYEDPQCHT